MTTLSYLIKQVRDKRNTAAVENLAEFADAQRDDLRSSYIKKSLEAKYSGTVFVSPEQDNTAKEISAKFLTGKRLVTLIAEPQWGKTGTVLTAAYYLCTHNDDMDLVDASQVFIITGLSDTVWERQTRERMLPQFEKNVYHRARINSVIPAIADASNALVIIDECHYASASDQTIKLALEDAGLLDMNNLVEKNIRIIQTSATPDNVLIDSNSWGSHHAVVKPVSRCSSYCSFSQLFAADRFRESLDLTDPYNVETLFEVMLQYKRPRYHIIRLPRRGVTGERSTILDNLKAFCEDFCFPLLCHDSDCRIRDIDGVLAKEPRRHTIIVITDYWRAAKTINDAFVGVVHERLVKKVNSTTIVQSLAGRFVGHNKNVNGPIIYTHLGAVEQYIDLCEKEFNYMDVKYYSVGIRSNGAGKITIKQSYAHTCNGVDHQYVTIKENPYGWRLFFGDVKHTPREEAEEFVRTHLMTKLPKKKRNADGFYVQNDVNENPLYLYSKYFRDDKPYNKRIFKGLSGNNAKKTTNWRQYALYRDTCDLDSLIWFVCWRKNVYGDLV